MKLSRYLAFAVAALARIDQGGTVAAVTAHALTRAGRVSDLFARKVLGRLAAAGILLSQHGTYGGYRLTRPLKDITLLEVVEAVDGPLLAPAEGGQAGAVNPLLRAVCDEVAGLARRRLAGVTLAEFAKGE
jgi:Rrf2 family protein